MPLKHAYVHDSLVSLKHVCGERKRMKGEESLELVKS